MSSTRSTALRIIAAAAAATLTLLVLANEARAADGLTVGTGQSTLADASAAMDEAADAAITALGGKTASVVFAWVESGNEDAFSGLSTKFTGSAKIYGIPGKDLFDESGRGKKAIVYALAGEVQAAHSLVARTENYSDAGSKVGTALKAIQTKASDDKLFILLGDQNNPKDNDVVSGFLKAYGDSSVAVTGGSSGKVFVDGKVASTSILGILLYGAFDHRSGFEEGLSPSTAQTALTTAKDASRSPTLSIVFDCLGRYEKLGQAGLTSEYAFAKQLIGPNVPFVGGYYSGEIGNKNSTSKAFGSGGAFSIVNLYSRSVTPGGNGSPDAGRPKTPEELLADDIEHMMIEHYMKAYFPKIIDKTGGGVYMCFNSTFNPTSSSKNLNIESRHLFSSSMAAMMRPEYAGFREAADAIFAFIRDKLWDKTNGGRAIRAGTGGGFVGPSCDKPLYHNGFALVGLAAYYLATKDPEALDIAISTWKWIESKAYDTENGMYYGSLDSEGNVVGGKGKNQDVLHHWIEGMAWLYIAWPADHPDTAGRELLKKRVKESTDIFTSDKWVRSNGSIILDNNREMTGGTGTNDGLDAEDVYLFYFYYMAIDTAPPQAAIDNLKKVHAYVRTRSTPGKHFASQWWPDAELFTSYCSMAVNFKAGDSYLQDCKTHWEYIKAHYFDPINGGWYRDPDATNSAKGDEWECTYHAFKCMLFARNLLLGSQKGWIDPIANPPIASTLDAGIGTTDSGAVVSVGRDGGGNGGGERNDAGIVGFDGSAKEAGGGIVLGSPGSADCSCALGGRNRHGVGPWSLLIAALFLMVRKSRSRSS